MGTLSTVPRGWPAAVLLVGTLALGLASSGAQAAGVQHRFDIPAQPLGAALDEFARQADVTLLFSSALVSRAHTAGVHGDLAVSAALDRLLGGTGLAFRQVSPSAIAIVPLRSQTAAARDGPAAAAGARRRSGTGAPRPATTACRRWWSRVRRR